MTTSSWDIKFMQLAETVASWSKDRSRKIGACIVDNNKNHVLALGYNGLPRGIADEVEARHQRPAKYLWAEHAERNAIFDAARRGAALEGGILYSVLFPCAHCARAISQVEISRVVSPEPNWEDPTYKEEFEVSRVIFEEKGIQVEWFPPELMQELRTGPKVL